MFSKNEILEELRRGVSPQDIGDRMAAELNAAVRDYNDEKAAAATNRKKARTAVDALVDYFEHVFKENVDEQERERLTDVLEKTAAPTVSDDEVIKAFLSFLE